MANPAARRRAHVVLPVALLRSIDALAWRLAPLADQRRVDALLRLIGGLSVSSATDCHHVESCVVVSAQRRSRLNA